MKIEKLIQFFRETYSSNEFIPLHAPSFSEKEELYVLDTIKSTFVSSVGKYVSDLETQLVEYTGAKAAVATVNGTAALHAALYLSGVQAGDLVITQALTFVATCNAIYHLGASPAFVDISEESLGMCPKALNAFLEDQAFISSEGITLHRKTFQKIAAVVPMHTFGHPVDLDEIELICNQWNLPLIEDAAESLGSFYKGQHTGTASDYAALSFNGNKIITTGGGGAILSRKTENGVAAKHITTTAKLDHPYEFFHDTPAFNYRMPNLNAALGCAQMSRLSKIVSKKRELAQHYMSFFDKSEFVFIKEPHYAKSNYWLNALLCPTNEVRNELLMLSNDRGVMMRPVWRLMNTLPMFRNSVSGDLSISIGIERKLINIPSSPIL
jgi:aminotransferase in exopolysaccharide biosynthesis